MTMNTEARNQLVIDLGKTVIPQVAPYEMQLFQTRREEYLQNPEAEISRRMGQNAGIGENLIFLAPVIYNIFAEALEMLDKDKESRSRLDKTTPGLWTRTLSSRQVNQIRQFAFRRALDCKLSLLKSHIVADAIARQLGNNPCA